MAPLTAQSDAAVAVERTTTLVYRVTVLLMWALALWHSAWARGLFLDGHFLLLGMLKYDGLHLFYGQRLHLMALTQAPAALAIRLGVSDTQVLAQLLSLGLFAVPTAFYHAALFRTRRDPMLLATVVVAIACVFLPTSFFIAGEYNTLCAIAVFTAVMLATGARLGAADGLVLAATALLTLRSYEMTAFVGPWLAGLVVWRLAASQWKTAVSALYVVAAALFAGSGIIGAQAMLHLHDAGFVQGSLFNAANFWRNLQFDLPVAAFVSGAGLVIVAPERLGGRGALLWPGLFLAVLAASPLLWLFPGDLRPFAKSQYEARLAALLLAVVLATAIFLAAVAPRLLPRGLAIARRPGLARRLLLIAFAAVLAALPVDLLLTELWRRSLVEFQAAISRESGIIPVEKTALAREPYRHMVELWTLPSESLILRRAIGDGIVVPPPGYLAWQPFDARAGVPDIGRYVWGGSAGR